MAEVPPQAGNDRSEPLPLEIEQLVDTACDQIEAALRRGEWPPVEEYLPSIPTSGRTLFLSEVVRLLLTYGAVRR